MTWPTIALPFSRSTRYYSPLLLLSRYGLSICVGVAGEDELRALADAAGDRLHLVRREVLALVHDHELVRDAPAADVGQRLEHDLPALHQLLDPLLDADDSDAWRLCSPSPPPLRRLLSR